MNQFESVVPILNVKNFAASMSYHGANLASPRNGIGALLQRLVV